MNLATIGWPSGADTGWPSEPRNMLPGRVEGFPAGVQASANTAERLLTQAVAYWDASQFRNGDRFLRNRGVAGDLLDLRLGSSIAPNSNDPRYLAPEDQGYVFIPGPTAVITADCLTVPDAVNLRLTGDLEMIFRVRADDWTPSKTNAFGGKDNTSIGRGYSLRLFTNGTLGFSWSSLGTDATGTTITSTAAVPFADGDAGWVRVTFDADNGAFGHDTAFYTAPDSPTVPSSWTQLGAAVTTAGVASIFATTQPMAFGYNRASERNWHGRLYRMIVKDGIDGTTVLDIDCDTITSGSATSFTAVTGQTVTINRSTSGRKSVAVPSRANRGGALFLFGTDDYMQVTDNWQHQLLNFGQGDSFTVLAVARRWSTFTNNTGIVAKSVVNTNAATGWLMRANASGTGGFVAIVKDGTNGSSNAAPVATAGQLAIYVGVRNTVADNVTGFLNGTSSTPSTDTTTGSLSNSEVMRIGRYSGAGPSYTDMELLAVAVFRRALTPAEIKTINSYFQGRIA